MDKQRKNLTTRIAIAGIILVAAILILGTIWTGQRANRDTDEAVRSVSLLFLDELAGRRGQVVEDTLNDNIEKIRVATGLMTEEDLSAGFEYGWVELLELNKFIAAEGTQEKIDNAVANMKKGRIKVFSGNYTGVNPINPADTIDLNDGYTECQYSSNPSFSYVLKDYITVEN